MVEQGFNILVKIALIILAVITFKAFRGPDKKFNQMEVVGLWCLALVTYIVVIEGRRDHEWHYFNEYWIAFLCTLTLLSLGFKDIIMALIGKINRKEQDKEITPKNEE